MSDIVLSKLLRRVLGLVIVVPKLACRLCPRLKPVTGGIVGEPIGDGMLVGEVLMRESELGEPRPWTKLSRLSETPLGNIAGDWRP